MFATSAVPVKDSVNFFLLYFYFFFAYREAFTACPHDCYNESIYFPLCKLNFSKHVSARRPFDISPKIKFFPPLLAY